MELIGLYPLFYFPEIGSAWLMGITATIHIMASHTSVGAALLFVFLARKAYKEDRADLYKYMKKYGMFLLIFSYVLGSITGPGIWYTATIASPRGISALIHNFVWVWATEWVFFLIEVIGVFVLVYTIDKIDRRTHLRITYMFALASVSTLFLIVGIISFMMWPGSEVWYQTGSASDAYFGINTFPHLIVRLGFMIIMSVVIGFIITSRLKDINLSKELTKKLSLIGFFGMAVMLLGFLWYIQTLPDNAWAVYARTIGNEAYLSRLTVILIVGGYLLLAYILPRAIKMSLAIIMLFAIGIFGLWPNEKMRESMRKPYVVGQYVYSNQLIARDVKGKGIKSDMDLVAQKGLLKVHPFIPQRLRTITKQNKLEVGEVLTKIACSNCHSMEMGALFRSLPTYFKGQDADNIELFLKNVVANGFITYMPKLKLPDNETRAIAEWLATKTNVKGEE